MSYAFNCVFLCMYSNLHFKKKSNRQKNQHVNVVHGETKNFECNVCNAVKFFTRLDYLQKHMSAVHEGQRNYSCNSCKKSFTQSGHLKNPIKTIHKGQRNYKCEFCEKLFTISGNLK